MGARDAGTGGGPAVVRVALAAVVAGLLLTGASCGGDQGQAAEKPVHRLLVMERSLPLGTSRAACPGPGHPVPAETTPPISLRRGQITQRGIDRRASREGDGVAAAEGPQGERHQQGGRAPRHGRPALA